MDARFRLRGAACGCAAAARCFGRTSKTRGRKMLELAMEIKRGAIAGA